MLSEWYTDALPLSIYCTGRKLQSLKVRVFVDYIVEEFRARGHAACFQHV